MSLKIVIPAKWSPAIIKAHADYFVKNSLKVLNAVHLTGKPLHGKQRQHLLRNLQALRSLATKGHCPVYTADQARFVNRQLNMAEKTAKTKTA